MREAFLAVWAFVRFFTTVNSQVFFQVVLVLEGLATLRALELAVTCSLG